MAGGFEDRLKNYASAGMRWGLCIEDHPDSQRNYYDAMGVDLGEPFSTRWPDKRFVVCELFIPGHAETHTGYKEIPERVKKNQSWVQWENTWDNYAILQTQALGRALRSAGYPHNIPDLKMVMLWRRRNAEVDSLITALDEAGVDEESDDEADEPSSAPPPSERKPSMAESARPTPGTAPPSRTVDILAPVMGDDAMRSMLDQMTEPIRAELGQWLAAQGTFKPVTVRAYMKHLLEREHTKAMKEQPSTPNEPPTDWVQDSLDKMAQPKPEPAPPPEQDEALLGAIAELRDRLRHLATERSDDYAACVTALANAGIEMSDRLTFEQVMEVDTIVAQYEQALTK